MYLNDKIKYLVIILSLPLSLFCQSSPDYQERTFFLTADSSYNRNAAPNYSGGINPDEYIIGPGDKLSVVIRGINEEAYILPVNIEGLIEVPKVGFIDVNGKNLIDTKESLRRKILSVYKNVEINISLSEVKNIKIYFIGFIKKPVSAIVKANFRILDVLLSSVELLAGSDLRNINIIRNNKAISLDLLSFLRLGNAENNPYLNEGDIISISRTDRVVSIDGAVQNPGVFEYVDGEDAFHLLSLAGGFLDKARTDSIEITSFEADKRTLTSKFYSYNYLKENKIILNKSDKIIVREKPEYLVDRYIHIEGFVKYPGTYKIIKDKTLLSEVINEAGGFLEAASLKDAYIIRKQGSEGFDPELERLKLIPRADMTDDEYDYLKSKSRLIKGRMVIDFEKLFLEDDKSEDLILLKEDQIFVPEKKDYITLLGQVNNPGAVIYKEGLTIRDYIKLAGGFGWRALKNDIRVVKHNTGEWIEEDDVDQLESGDIIWIPEDPPPPRFWDVFERTMNILGQVATVFAATVAIIVATR